MEKSFQNVFVQIVMVFLLAKVISCGRDHHELNNGVHEGASLGLVRREGGMAEAIARSKERVRMFLWRTGKRRHVKDVQSPMHAGDGEFLMQIGIGSPVVTYNAIMDTGSDLIWTQCEPCEHCYAQPGRIFDPSKSRTYSLVPCSSSFCQALPSPSCESKCRYVYQYGDASLTEGDLGFETFTLGDTNHGTVRIPRVAFGCGHDNEGTGFTQGGGLVGMGRGPLSLISQMGSAGKYRFSYCLVSINEPASKTSPLLFGDAANLGGSRVKSTPIVESKNDFQSTFYYLNLQGVSVGMTRVNIPAGTFKIKNDGSGGLIIDSGTTITYLEQSAFDLVKTAVEKAVKARPVNGSAVGLDLCYKLPFGHPSSLKLPIITFHFEGANFYLPEENSFYTDTESGLICLAMAGADGMSIFGNIQQQNYHILYDLTHNILSFTPTNCAAAAAAA